MHIIKQAPEDFIVKEVSNLNIKPEGDFAYFKLKKTNYNTLKAIETIARILGIPINNIGFAGNKDRVAITEQFISVPSSQKERLENINLSDLTLEFVDYGDNYIALGDLLGNEFIITVKNINQTNINKFEKRSKTRNFPNYFGEQRFSEKNADIGKAIINRNFQKAATLLKLDIIDDNDYIGAMRKFNKKLLKLYVHSYQSLIFNKTIKEYLKISKEQQKIPIIGFGTELEEYPKELQNIINNILKNENLTKRDFITVKMPELSQEGDERNLLTEIENLEIIEKEENKIKIKFFLKKGCYATVAIKYLFS